MSTSQSATAGGPTDAMRDAWRHAHVRPLWENPIAHRVRDGGPRAHLWQWSELGPLVAAAMQMTSMAAIERRVLTLVDPEADGNAAGTTTNLTTALQILMPGESARPHRHSMNALRFVIDGNGASTKVDGRDCPMEQGDLVITPGWTWHEHVHHGSAPIVWLDALDAPLHRYLGTDVFEPGPARESVARAGDAAFAMPNIVPELADPPPAFSPVFRYPWTQAVQAVAAAPIWKDGTRRVRYVNPLTGGPVMALMDCYLVQLEARAETVPFRTTGNAVCAVVEGSGTSRIGDETLAWGPKDIFSMPHGNSITHRADERARLFVVTDRDVLRRLDLLKEEFGNERR
ncbi:MAG TPA: cupin domain-containing protein, partial [Xanthobacteraceae bacterium]